MGSSFSHAADLPPPSPPFGGGGDAHPEPKEPEAKTEEQADYLNLPCPIPYEEIQREALMSLKPELFEGLRFDFTKALNQKFALSHSVFMGTVELPSQSKEIIKVPTAQYEFGANFLDPKLMMVGRILTDGTLAARVKCDLTENLTLKVNAQIQNEPHFSQGAFSFDYKGKDFRSQFQMGNGAFYGINYIQLVHRPVVDCHSQAGDLVNHPIIQRQCPSVSPHLSLGTEAFWAGHQRKSGIGFAARYNTDKMVAVGQIANTGILGLSYVQKVSEKVSLASDLIYNHTTRDITSSFGYDCIFRQCRLRGKMDSNGCVAAYLEERLNMGINLVLSAEINHANKDYKIGLGLILGE